MNPFVASIKNKDTSEVVLEIAGAKHLTQDLFMHILGFGILSYASLPRLRNRICACKRVELGSWVLIFARHWLFCVLGQIPSCLF